MSLQFGKIDVTAAGDTVIVTGSTFPQKRIRVLSYTFLADANVNVTWKSGSTAISGAMPIIQYGGMHCTSNYLAPGGPMALLSTVNDEDNLVLNLSGPANVQGFITYYAISG
jgi:hypothetical protein